MALARQIAALLVLTGIFTSGAFAASGDDYPARPVKIIVPFGAGGPTDVYARAIGEELRKSLHQPFVMENRPGAGTTIGTEAVAKSAPDGYTLLMVSGTQTVNETLYSHKQYQLMRDLVPVAPLIDTDLVLVVHPSVPANNLNELMALARPNPARSIMALRVRARTITWPASFSRISPASISCMCRIKARPARATTFSAGRSR